VVLSLQLLGLGGNNQNKNGVSTTSKILKNAKSNNIQAAVLVPGFLTGADEFESLCQALTDGGLPTIAIPMPAWHWVSCLGGRSARPILERIDYTVKHLIANDGDVTKVPKNFDYSLVDAYGDFMHNPGGILAVGGSQKVEEYPMVEPRGKFILPQDKDLAPNTKVALIGHSAGGWISRAYLSDRSYGGKVYGGQKYVHSLVTLGTPHMTAPGPAFAGVQWCNQEPATVRSLAVAGSGFRGAEWGGLTQGAYAFCCPNQSDGTSYDGDGITPVGSALALKGAEQMTFDDVTHFCWSDLVASNWVAPELTKAHKEGRPWYGDEGIIEKWADWIV